MEILNQVLILVLISFLSEVISHFTPFILPPTVISMVLLFSLLLIKAVKTEKIKEVSVFSQSNLALFLIPPSLTIMDGFDLLKDKFFKIFAISFISFVVTFLFTAYSVTLVIKIQEKFRRKNNE